MMAAQNLNSRRARRLGALALLLLTMLPGCLGSGAGPAGMLGTAPPHIAGSDALFHDAPGCALVMPVAGAAGSVSAEMVETVTARHFGQRLARVVGPAERRARARAGAYDLADPLELARFSRKIGCGYGLEVTVHAAGAGYAIAWAGRHIDLTVSLLRLSDETRLWSARHALERSAGGLPTGALSLVLDTARANSFARNRDGAEALVEDVVRQVAQSFPDLWSIR